jgi:hypothetical protein
MWTGRVSFADTDVWAGDGIAPLPQPSIRLSVGSLQKSHPPSLRIAVAMKDLPTSEGRTLRWPVAALLVSLFFLATLTQVSSSQDAGTVPKYFFPVPPGLYYWP